MQLGNQTDPTLEWGATLTPRVGLGSDRVSVTNNRCLKMTHIVLDANPHFLQTSLINPFLIAKKQFIYYHSCAACENLLLAIEEKKNADLQCQQYGIVISSLSYQGSWPLNALISIAE